MNASTKIKPTHLSRSAYVYVRQSTERQVQHNLESQQRQYELADLAVRQGWVRESVVIIDDDLGRSGGSTAGRVGFARLVAEVALRKAGVVFGLEVSRLARNNRDWYQLLDLCSMTETLIADADGVYDPACFNDRLLLGLKGTMSEAELHVLQGRMLAGLQHKAAKGELRFPLPAGYQFDGQSRIVQSPDERVRHAIELVFRKTSELGSVNRVVLSLLREELLFPRKTGFGPSIRWVRPYYKAIYDTVTNPLYAGVYAYGRSKIVKELDPSGAARSRQKKQPMEKWQVVIQHHHPGYVTWDDFLKIRKMLEKNRPAVKDQASLALREGCAWLVGLASCGKCGRPMRVRYHQGVRGAVHPTYVCRGGSVSYGQPLCQAVGSRRIDEAVASHFLEQVEPVKLELQLETLRRCQSERDEVLAQLELELEGTRYQAERMERQYHAAEPENRLVARTLETQWNEALERAQAVEARIAERRRARGAGLSQVEEAEVRALVQDLPRLWNASTTSDRDRKELLRAAIDRVRLRKDGQTVELKIVWKGGAAIDKVVQLPKLPTRMSLNADAVALIRELAAHHTDKQIRRILMTKGIKTAKGEPFTDHRVACLRLDNGIPCYRQSNDRGLPSYTVDQAARLLQVATGTIHRWLTDGVIKGDQITSGAPWRIRLSEEDRKRLTAGDAPAGWLSLNEAALRCRVSKQAVLQWVKQGNVPFVYVTKGKRRGLRIDVTSTGYKTQAELFS
jgi:DNA invertase Pin-like site-specific DNA recombinase